MALAFVTDIENKIHGFFEEHAAELEHAGQAVTAVESSPLAQAALAAVNVPPNVVQAFADALQRVDAEFGRLAAEHAQAVADAHDAGKAEAQAAQPEQPAGE